MNYGKLTVSALLAGLLAVGLAACGGGSGGGETTATNGDKGVFVVVPTIVVKNAEPVGGVRRLEYSAGEDIRFKVKSDTADEVHFHGYDIGKDVAAGGTVSFNVPAEIEGIFEVELEEHHEQIAEVRVNP